MIQMKCLKLVIVSILFISHVCFVNQCYSDVVKPNEIQDDVYSDLFIFDNQLNLIRRRADADGFYLQRPQEGTHCFIEAKDLRYNSQFVDTEWTMYPAVWPLFNAGAICKAGPNKYKAWVWTNEVSEKITPKVAGLHKLWIRWVRWKQLSAPLIVRIKQNDKTVAEKVLGVEANVLNMLQAQVVWESIDVVLDSSSVRIELEKPADETLAGDRIIDCLYLTSNVGYIPIGRNQLPEIDQLQKKASQIADGKSFVMWTADEPWRGYGIYDWPMGADIVSNVNIEACINEKEPFLLKLTSMGDSPLNLSIKTEPFKNKQGKTFGEIEIRIAALMNSLGYGWTVQPLLRRSSVDLAPYHTAGLWVTVDTTGMPAGTYQGKIIFTNDKGSEHLIINLTVLPIKIERRPEFWTKIWGHPVPCPDGVDTKEQYLKDLASHGINWLQYARMFTEPMYTDLVKKLGFVAGHDTHGNGVDWTHFMNRKDYDSDAFKETMVRALSGTAEWRDKLDFDGKLFSTCFEDEQSVSEHWLRVFTAAKATNIELLLRMNPVHLTIEDVNLMDGLIDIWIPHENVFTDRKTTEALLSAKGKKMTYGIYYLDNANPERSWRSFRKLPWKAFSIGLDGCAFWNYAAYQGEPWDDFDFPGNVPYFTGAGQAAVVYPGTKGPVPTPSWEAWREGREEVDLMYILRDEIKKSEQSGNKQIARQAQFVLDKAISLVLNAEDPSDYTKAKRMIVIEILKVRNS